MTTHPTHPAVDAYLVGLDHPLAPLVRAIHADILALDAGVSASIKWNAPSYAHHGADRITFQLRRPDRIVLVLHRGAKAGDATDFRALIPDPAGLLTWPAPDRATATIGATAAPEVDRAQLRTTLAAWLAATVSPARGSPAPGSCIK